MNTMQEVVDAFGSLRWTREVDSRGNGFAYSVLGGNRESDEIYVLAVIQNAEAPRHTHGVGGTYGEKVGTFIGELHDVDEDGRPIQIGPQDVHLHRPGSTHAPRADFWFGFYHQPRGAKLALEDENLKLA
jgi:hypothetical protein